MEKIVVGLPKNMNNTLGERAEKSLEFKEMLEKRTGLPVEMWDERLTTMERTAFSWRAECAVKTERNIWIPLQQY